MSQRSTQFQAASPSFVDAIAVLQTRWDLLRHPFYRRWSAGELALAELGVYAGQYEHVVIAFAAAARHAAAIAPARLRAALSEPATEARRAVARLSSYGLGSRGGRALRIHRAVVDRYIRDRKPEGVFGRGLTVTPEFLDDLDELLRAAVEAGTLSEEEGAREGEERYSLQDVGDLVAVARARIERILEHEADLGADVENDDVPQDEQQQQIALAALKKLRANELQSIATKLDLLRISDSGTLIDAIARKVEYDLPQIAELVIDAEEERLDLGAVSRLIPLRGPPCRAPGSVRTPD